MEGFRRAVLTEKRLLRPTALKRLKDTYRDKGVLLPQMERHVMKSLTRPARPDDHSTAAHAPERPVPSPTGADGTTTTASSARRSRRCPRPTPASAWRTSGPRAPRSTASTKPGCGRWACCSGTGSAWSAVTVTVHSPHRVPVLPERLASMYSELPMRHKQLHGRGPRRRCRARLTGGVAWSRSSRSVSTRGASTHPRLYNRYQAGESAEDIWIGHQPALRQPHPPGPVVPLDDVARATSRSSSSTSPSSTSRPRSSWSATTRA